MGNQKYGYNYGYTPAPTMSISINQGPTSPTGAAPPPAAAPYFGGNRSRPPASAPPPPPSYGHSAHYEDPNTMWFDRFHRRENRGMFRLALVELMLAFVILAGGIWCARDTADYCPYYSGIWTSVFFIANAIAGLVAAKVGGLKSYQAHLILSMICIVMSLVSFGISMRNWLYVGTYHHPRIERGQAFCLLGQHDPGRISHIYSNMDKYDFSTCLWQLKVGVAVNSVQMTMGGLLFFLNLISTAICVRRTCTTH